jgi:hypothetical protein
MRKERRNIPKKLQATSKIRRFQVNFMRICFFNVLSGADRTQELEENARMKWKSF